MVGVRFKIDSVRKRFWLAAGVLTCVLAAQTPKPTAQTAPPKPQTEPSSAPEHPGGSQRVFVLKYADPAQTASLLRAFGARAVVDSEAHAVAVMTVFPDTLAAIDDAIQRLDVPTAALNIELTAYFVIGGAAPSPLGSALPKDFQPMTAELTKVSSYANFRLLDALTVRMRAGQGADTSGTAGTVANGSPMIATGLRVGSATVASDGATVRVDRLTASVKMPVAAGNNQYTSSDLSLNADEDLKDGERVVVGRVGMNRDQALFLVLLAHVAK